MADSLHYRVDVDDDVDEELHDYEDIERPSCLVLKLEVWIGLTKKEEVIGGDENDCFVECLQPIQKRVLKGLYEDNVVDCSEGDEDDAIDLEWTIPYEDQDASNDQSPEQEKCIVALSPFTISL